MIEFLTFDDEDNMLILPRLLPVTHKAAAAADLSGTCRDKERQKDCKDSISTLTNWCAHFASKKKEYDAEAALIKRRVDKAANKKHGFLGVST